MYIFTHCMMYRQNYVHTYIYTYIYMYMYIYIYIYIYKCLYMYEFTVGADYAAISVPEYPPRNYIWLNNKKGIFTNLGIQHDQLYWLQKRVAFNFHPSRILIIPPASQGRYKLCTKLTIWENTSSYFRVFCRRNVLRSARWLVDVTGKSSQKSVRFWI